LDAAPIPAPRSVASKQKFPITFIPCSETTSQLRGKYAESTPQVRRLGAKRSEKAGARIARQDRSLFAGASEAKSPWSIAQGVHFCLCILATLVNLRFPNIENNDLARRDHFPASR